jgi:hypothetical protein
MYFTNNTLPNTHIEFTADGVVLWVSLNIEHRMIPHLEKTNVFKGKEFQVYALRKLVENPNKFTIEQTWKVLLTRCMVNCREAKIKAIEQEIKQLTMN